MQFWVGIILFIMGIFYFVLLLHFKKYIKSTGSLVELTKVEKQLVSVSIVVAFIFFIVQGIYFYYGEYGGWVFGFVAGIFMSSIYDSLVASVFSIEEDKVLLYGVIVSVKEIEIIKCRKNLFLDKYNIKIKLKNNGRKERVFIFENSYKNLVDKVS
ncbi:hypothetical protein EDC18_105114 [Natranaerovirga pectinivora]|uniref:DUF5673 domain-containing protein n=1 Tax=Natranaerovirga pectinivora TaxID=682400 RepID=A0A4V2V087_9FIRM|nr:hypothetical protein [Natranaerovirga pectinivora]TCT14633.1 hypothetical protein EDC18_105114 [Natranaerovirga pectinivora]